MGPALGGLLGELGPRVPFFAAAGLSAINFVYGWFVLPETLPTERRRAFEWRRANPFGAFKVFRTYPGVIPLCGVLALYFFATSVYPAIWPFWGIAKFGWSEAMIGLTLAIFGIVMALFQGGLSGPAVKRFGEHRTTLIGLFSAVIAVVGYGFAGGIVAVAVLMVVHGPEGFIQPMITAMMSKVVPEDAQGELQGGISAITNIAMLAGTVFFSQIFGFFMAEGSAWKSPDVGFFIAGGLLFATLLLFQLTTRRSDY
jgi:MFS transporter, DHA1 family, tetracycline resistance protein